jgi:alcohol dehydrogenase (NADP+)
MHQSLSLVLGLSAIVLGQTFTVPTPPKGTKLDAIPRIGFGTSRIDKSNTTEVVAKAIENGYRHIDGAYIYGNQKEVGEGIKEGLRRTGLKREDLWVTSKLWNSRCVTSQVVFQIQQHIPYLDRY